MQNVTPLTVAVLAIELVPAAAVGLAAERVTSAIERCPYLLRALVPASFACLSHFNKRNLGGAHFNWRYVLLATIAGIFYGRAWRQQRRVPASTITHTCVDWLWSWWF